MSFKTLQAQNDSLPQKQTGGSAEDPNNFFTRTEVFNKLVALRNGEYLNTSTLRAIVNLGKGFTTRVDIPLVYNSNSTPQEYSQFGIGDISIRVLGYKLIDHPKAAIVASVEFSFNTASSPILGTSKNIIIPTVTYSFIAKPKKSVVAFSAQQFNSVGGDKARPNINFTKVQIFYINLVSKTTWFTIRPDWYLDYKNDGVSLNIEASVGHVFTQKSNIWCRPGIGVFGDHVARYKWSIELGYRRFLFSNPFKSH